jgi:hypothetical protein
MSDDRERLLPSQSCTRLSGKMNGGGGDHRLLRRNGDLLLYSAKSHVRRKNTVALTVAFTVAQRGKNSE